MFLRRAASEVYVWRASFGHVGLSYRHSMIWGMFAIVKGGFSRAQAVAAFIHHRVCGHGLGRMPLVIAQSG